MNDKIIFTKTPLGYFVQLPMGMIHDEKYAARFKSALADEYPDTPFFIINYDVEHIDTERLKPMLQQVYDDNRTGLLAPHLLVSEYSNEYRAKKSRNEATNE